MRNLRAALIFVWIVGGIAAFLYSQNFNIPARLAVPVAVAFLVELSFYAGMQSLPWPAGLLWASTFVSYAIYSVPTGVFSWQGLALLALITGAAVGWMRYLPRGAAADIALLGLFAVIYIGKVTHGVFIEPAPRLQTGALAQLMCFRLAVTGMLRYRSSGDLGFGFIPTAKDWKIGLRHFIYFVPVAAALSYVLEFRAFRLAPDFWWRAPLTFLAFLWVVALAEECLFRGLLLNHLRALMKPLYALALSSLAFGITHLWFRPFPNWKFVILASVAGLFYGRAYLEARAVRASMVAHALTVTAWRTFLA